MANYKWTYIDTEVFMSGSGPTGSIQYRAGDENNSARITGSSRLVYATSSDAIEFHGDINITGNLFVDGGTTSISSSNLIIKDPVIGIGFGTASAHTGAVGDRGFVFGLAGNNNQALIWDQTSGSFILGKTGATGPTETAFDIPFTDYSALKLSKLQFIQDLSGSGRLFGTGIETSGLLAASGTIKNKSFISSSGEIFSAAGLRTSGQASLSGTLIVSGNAHIGDDKKLYLGVNEDVFIQYDETGRDVLIISGSATRGIELSGSAIFVDANTIVSGVMAGPNSYLSIDTDGKFVLTGTLEADAGGTDQHIQFNNSDAFGGSANFLWDDTNVRVIGNVSGSVKVHAGNIVTSGDLDITGSLSGSSELFGTSLVTSQFVQASGAIKNKSFISSSGEVFAVGGLRASGDIQATGTLTSAAVTSSGASTMGSLSVGNLSGSGRLFGTGIETSGHLGVSGSIENGLIISSSGEVFSVGGLRTSGLLQVTGTVKNTSFISSSGEIFGTVMTTSGPFQASGSIESKYFISSSANVFGQILETSGDALISGSIKNNSFISSSGEVFGKNLRTSGALSVTGSTLLKDDTLILDDLVIEDDVILTGSLVVMSGTTKVLEVDGEEHDGTGVLLGRTRGRFTQNFYTNMQFGAVDAGDLAFITLSQNVYGTKAAQSSIDEQNAMIMPYSGRLVKCMFRTNQSMTGAFPKLQFWVGSINDANGTVAANACTMIGQSTASNNSGQNVVGSFDLTTPFQTTGSFLFGTGSIVAIEFGGGGAAFGDLHFTAVIEFNTLDEFITGSGN